MQNQIIFYKSQTWDIKINVTLKDETLWLSQKMMAELFWVQQPAIAKHLKNIFESWELEENSVYSKMEYTASDWKNYNTNFYKLDAVLSVWYRINSKQATQFRIWATSVLTEFIKKGFVMDDDRLKNWEKFWKDYFEELLERIRDIRSSERKFYQKLTDIFSLSADYDKDSEITKTFFATMQNKLHFAISGNTAAEIIFDRVDSEKENMGLTNWKDAPNWKIMKSDVSIAKNYLEEKEIQILNRLVNAYLDIAEIQAMEEEIMVMEDWKERMDNFLKWTWRKILENAWKITAKLAKDEVPLEGKKQKNNMINLNLSKIYYIKMILIN